VNTTRLPRPLLKPPARKGPWFRVASTALAIGLASIALLLSVDLLRGRLALESFGLSRAAGEIRAELATSHVWIEQYTSGDGVAPEDFWRALRRAVALLDALLDGAELSEGPWRVRRVEDAALRAEASALRQALRHFLESTLARQAAYERGEPAGPGTALDAAYDAEFRALAQQSDRLQAAAESSVVRRLRRLDLAFYAILALWAGVVATTFGALRRFEGRRLRAEAALKERESHLVQAQKMEAVGRLAGGVAHDINNYLAAIRAQAELVLRKPVPPESLRDKMTAVIGSVDNAAVLIQRLLAFGRRQPVRPEVVCLNQVVEAWRRMATDTLGDDTTLETHLEPDLWNVLVDRGQMEQVLVNLLVNAREAMPRGGRLSIVTENASFPEPTPADPVATAGDYVVLSVADSGPGIPTELHDRIFEPFFTTKEQRGNSGLGLATVYGIVKQSGGNIWATNPAGGGARFDVYLPRTEQAPVPAAAAVPAGGDERILLVEDNEDVRTTTAALLESVGYRVHEAASGLDALATLEGIAHLDLLITDVMMPGMGGAAVATKVRARIGEEVPVIFLSGYSDSVVGVRGILPGTELLTKPFTPEALFTVVRAVLGSSGASD
jgi:two-component system, cell cycle sensor histidine kinase and response regulator CckA